METVARDPRAALRCLVSPRRRAPSAVSTETSEHSPLFERWRAAESCGGTANDGVGGRRLRGRMQQHASREQPCRVSASVTPRRHVPRLLQLLDGDAPRIFLHCSEPLWHANGSVGGRAAAAGADAAALEPGAAVPSLRVDDAAPTSRDFCTTRRGRGRRASPSLQRAAAAREGQRGRAGGGGGGGCSSTRAGSSRACSAAIFY